MKNIDRLIDIIILRGELVDNNDRVIADCYNPHYARLRIETHNARFDCPIYATKVLELHDEDISSNRDILEYLLDEYELTGDFIASFPITTPVRYAVIDDIVTAIDDNGNPLLKVINIER